MSCNVAAYVKTRSPDSFLIRQRVSNFLDGPEDFYPNHITF